MKVDTRHLFCNHAMFTIVISQWNWTSICVVLIFIETFINYEWVHDPLYFYATGQRLDILFNLNFCSDSRAIIFHWFVYDYHILKRDHLNSKHLGRRFESWPKKPHDSFSCVKCCLTQEKKIIRKKERKKTNRLCANCFDAVSICLVSDVHKKVHAKISQTTSNSIFKLVVFIV